MTMTEIDEIVVTGTRREPRQSTCGCNSSSGGCGCGSGAGNEVGLERPLYFPRQIVGPDDLNQGQRYVTDKFRRHNRFLHGWGVACGLRVEWCGPEEDGSASCRVRVTAGYALDPYGDEIYVPSDQIIDLCKEVPSGGLACVPNDDPWCSPVDTLPSPNGMWLAVRHIEVPVKPVRAPTGCSCDEAHCEHSRIRDWYEFTLLPERPSHYDWPCGDIDDYCELVAECPPCPDSGWIVLARVHMAGSAIEEIHDDAGRRYVQSLAPLCPTCGPDRDSHTTHGYSVPNPATYAADYVASISATPDASLRVTFENDIGERRAVAIAVNTAEIEGQTGGDVYSLLSGAHFFNVTTGEPVLAAEGVPLTGAMVLTHSPLRGESVIDSLTDLTTRIGVPTLNPAAYVATMAEVRELVDNNGLREFERRSLNDVRELGALDVVALDKVSTANANKLRAFGIETLGDLRTADNLPSDLSKQAKETVEAMRDLLRRNG